MDKGKGGKSEEKGGSSKRLIGLWKIDYSSEEATDKQVKEIYKQIMESIDTNNPK